jgi:hypothetical protein
MIDFLIRLVLKFLAGIVLYFAICIIGIFFCSIFGGLDGVLYEFLFGDYGGFWHVFFNLEAWLFSGIAVSIALPN